MKILVADDHPMTLQGTVGFVESYGYEVSHICTNGSAAFSLIELHQPDIAILDINMPGLDGLDVTRKVQQTKLKTKVILLTMHNEKTLYNKAREFGAFGYVLKEHEVSELKTCLQEVEKGNHYISDSLRKELVQDQGNDSLSKLTFSERKIMELVSQQKTIPQIAALLLLPEKTVQDHCNAIIDKLGLGNEKDGLLKWKLGNDR